MKRWKVIYRKRGRDTSGSGLLKDEFELPSMTIDAENKWAAIDQALRDNSVAWVVAVEESK
jgi:hypothetical protein